MDKKGAGVLSPAPCLCGLRQFTELLLLDLEAEGHRSSNLILDLQEIFSCADLVMYDKCERTYPGSRVHAPGCDLAFLVSYVYLPLLGAEPQTV